MREKAQLKVHMAWIIERGLDRIKTWHRAFRIRKLKEQSEFLVFVSRPVEEKGEDPMP